MLEYIFNQYYDGTNENIVFYLDDISSGYRNCQIPEPASISNTILDLTRKKTGIDSRLPESIYERGYDLRKKTGQLNGRSYAGEFVYVGIGNEINSWLAWPEDDDIEIIEIDSSTVPNKILQLIRNDEGALFSIIDYTDTFTKIFGEQIHRVQNPMKWQPNEIDGFYISDEKNIVYPVEAKALTTNDDINLEQMNGAFSTIVNKLRLANDDSGIQQIAIKMIENGILVAIFPINTRPIIVERYVKIIYKPKINNWK
jgi:hypothetical protein